MPCFWMPAQYMCIASGLLGVPAPNNVWFTFNSVYHEFPTAPKLLA